MTPRKNIHFEISERKILLRFMDAVCVIGALYIVGASFEVNYFSVTTMHWSWSLVLSLYITLTGTVFELYDLKASSDIFKTFRNIVITTSLTVLLYLFTPIVTPFLPEKRIEVLYFFVTILIAILIWRSLYIGVIASPRFYKRVLVIGRGANLKSIHETIALSDPNYRIIGFINVDLGKEGTTGKYPDLDEYAPDELLKAVKNHQISEIIVAIYNQDNITNIIYEHLTILLNKGFTIREYTQVYEEMTNQIPVQYLGKDFYKYFPFGRSNQNRLYMFFHRLMDVISATIGICFGVLVLPLILIGNILGNKGALFYTQERVGKNGMSFKILKFRTMIKHAEKEGIQWAKKGDSRVTKFGRFLRNSRIDEIPQFYNILKGEMSVIGPRPERPHFVEKLVKEVPFYDTRHAIKPGLSGWAQVNSRYGDSMEDSLEKLQYDLYYIKHRGVFLDINILIKTIGTVLFYRGQ